MTRKFKLRFRKLLVLFLVAAISGILGYIHNTKAAGLSSMSDTMSRLAPSTVKSNHDIKFRTPSGLTGSGKTITINFNTAGFSSGTTAFGDIDLQYGSNQSEVNGSCSSGCASATLAASAGAGAWGAAFATNTLTFTYPTSGGTAIAANDYVRVLIGTNASGGTNQITNPGSTGTKTIAIAVDPAGANDIGSLAVVIVTNDQVVVSTTIDPYLSFTVNQNSVTLTKSGGGNPDYSNTGYNQGTANTLAANTNAATGYNISYNGTTLTNGSYTIDALATKGVSSTGTEQFGINLKANTTPSTGADPSGGSGAPASDYNTANQYRFIAGATTTLASASASTAQTTYTASYVANASQTTEPGAYSTTLTYICTGNY